MCGIFAVVNDESGNAAQTVLSGLKKLEYRGYDSWGVAIKADKGNKLLVDKHIGKIGTASTNLPKSLIFPPKSFGTPFNAKSSLIFRAASSTCAQPKATAMRL